LLVGGALSPWPHLVASLLAYCSVDVEAVANRLQHCARFSWSRIQNLDLLDWLPRPRDKRVNRSAIAIFHLLWLCILLLRVHFLEKSRHFVSPKTLLCV